jgi:ferrous iron transport protein A
VDSAGRNIFEAYSVIDRAVPISQLVAGQEAIVSRILGEPDHVHRLEEFGLHGGARIEMFRAGNPCIIFLGRAKVCLRCDDMLRILVEPAPAPDNSSS